MSNIKMNKQEALAKIADVARRAGNTGEHMLHAPAGLSAELAHSVIIVGGAALVMLSSALMEMHALVEEYIKKEEDAANTPTV